MRIMWYVCEYSFKNINYIFRSQMQAHQVMHALKLVVLLVGKFNKSQLANMILLLTIIGVDETKVYLTSLILILIMIGVDEIASLRSLQELE